jgi:Zn-dependent protease with chaperone function/Tfp pilus assembly protein PilF
MLLLLALLAAAPEAHPFTPAQDTLAEQAYQSLRRGDAAAARRESAQLVANAPDNPRAWRLKGIADAQAGAADEAEKALTRSLELGIDRERSADVLAMRGAMRLRANRRPAAKEDLEKALAIDPNQPFALMQLAAVLGSNGDLPGALAAGERLVKAHPEVEEGHRIVAAISADLGDTARARAEIARVREMGTKDEAHLRALEDAISGVERRSLIWKVPLAVVSAMALALLLLFAAGSLLSRMQVARLADVHAHVLRDEQTPGERRMLRLYSAVLWFGTVFFYFSVPAMVAISLLTGLGLIYAMFAYMSQIPIKLILILGLVALGGSWAIVRSLFLGSTPDDGELRITEKDEPRLFAALREVAEAAGSRMVDRVYLEADASVFVREAGGAFRILLGGGERVLHLGLWAMQGLTASELKAVLAHEYGHFAHGDTRLTPIIGRIVPTVVGILQRMAALGNSALINPVYWYLRVYFRVFFAATGGHSQRRELLADRTAALQYGGDAFGRGLRSVVEAGRIFEGNAGRLVVLLRTSGRPCTDLYACLRAARDAVPDRLRDEALQQDLEHEASQYDSHPPAKDRIARVAGVAARRPAEPEPAISLLADPAETARKITVKVVARVESRIPQQLPADKPMEGGAQEILAAALSLHEAALALQEKKDPEGDVLLVSALERMEAAVGPSDPLLVVPLKNLYHSHLRLGRKDEAHAALQRALGLSQDAESKQELEQLISQLRAAG